mgnify:CR=1 FL=1
MIGHHDTAGTDAEYPQRFGELSKFPPYELH